MNQKHAITERLASLQSWRYGMETQLARVADALREAGFMTRDTQLSVDDFLLRVKRQCVTIAFVAEIARGKSELINGLFFSDLGRRLLPAGLGRTTACVTELRFDRDIATGIRLLPIETRESARRFSELYADAGQWRSVGFEADDATSIARALTALSETKRISLAEAVAWGLHGHSAGMSAGPGGTTFVEVPRWRHAVINFPHPLLDAGLVIIDTPGLAALYAEPELARERLPGADALLLVIDATEGVTRPDLAIWKEHLAGGRSIREREQDENNQARIVVLNKIDELQPDPAASAEENNKEWLRDLDRRVKEAADLLRIDPIKVVPVSAKLGLLGKLVNDTDRILKSRLYQLERCIVGNLPNGRQDSLTGEITSTLSALLETAQAQLDQDRFQAVKGLSELSAVRAKNEKLMAALATQTSLTHGRLEAMFRDLRGVKSMHARLAEELAAIVDMAAARKDMQRARLAISNSMLPSSAFESCNQYFALTEEKLDAIELKVDEIRALFTQIGSKIRKDFDLGSSYQIDAHPFATQRFQAELGKAREKAEKHFGKNGTLFMRRGQALADDFEALIGSRVLHVFEIASRETATWMRGLYSTLEQPLEAIREREGQRASSIEKVKAAELDLAERISELQAHIDVAKQRHLILAEARQGLERYLGVDVQLDARVDAG